MNMIDAHDSAERTFAASLHGVDLTKNPRRPGHSSNSTRTGFDSFMRENFDAISKAANA
jgi:hypothetical protein